MAISRQRGSGGTYVGRTLADRLQYRYIDRELLREACEFLRTRDESPQAAAAASSWWSRLGEAFAIGSPDSGYTPPPAEAVYEGELFDIQKKLFQDIAQEHMAVIVGRGAAQTMRGRPGVVSVLLHAPEPWRVERVQQVYRIDDHREALRMVQDSDRERARFIQALADLEWTDVRGYDIVINTAAVGFAAAVDIIAAAVGAPART